MIKIKPQTAFKAPSSGLLFESYQDAVVHEATDQLLAVFTSGEGADYLPAALIDPDVVVMLANFIADNRPEFRAIIKMYA